MPDSAKRAVESWPESVTSQDVATFALQRFGMEIARFVLCEQKLDFIGMCSCTKNMRAVVTKLDAYRRRVDRNYSAAAPANSKMEIPQK
jgi:hypothetical protein